MAQGIIQDHPPAGSSATGSVREWELLLCCARTSMDPGHAERINDLVREGVDWDRLIELASNHRVLPLLYWGLFTVCANAIPTATLKRLQRKFSLNAARNRELSAELLEILKWHRAEEIPALTYKGPTLAGLAYGGLALRQAGDLDILVRKQDALRAKRLMLSRGFHPYHPGMTDNQECKLSHHFMLVRDHRSLTVEIHWQLIDDWLCFNLSEESLLRNASSTRLGGESVACFPDPELLIYLCAHGSKHCWERLSWICDIAELMREERAIDWALVMRKARAMGAERMVHLGMYLAMQLLEVPQPKGVLDTIGADETVRELARAVYERLLRETDSEPEFAQIWRFNLTARERRRDRLRCRLKFISGSLSLHERDFNVVHLPSRLSFLHHGVKLLRLAIKYGTNPSKLGRVICNLMGAGPVGRTTDSRKNEQASFRFTDRVSYSDCRPGNELVVPADGGRAASGV